MIHDIFPVSAIPLDWLPRTALRYDTGMTPAALLLSLIMLMTAPFAASPAGDDDLVGRPAKELRNLEWVQGGPLVWPDLRGKVVLVRWWTGPGCPYCRSSAPRLRGWHEELAPRGLVIMGLYHHKSGAALSRERVRRQAEELGMAFPIAIDPEWTNLRRWWLDTGDRSFTSVSFLIDRRGIIRLVHPGGSYEPAEAERMGKLIRRLLDEAPQE